MCAVGRNCVDQEIGAHRTALVDPDQAQEARPDAGHLHRLLDAAVRLGGRVGDELRAGVAQAVAAEAQSLAEVAPIARKNAKPPFEIADVRAFIARNAALLQKTGHGEIAASLESLDIDALYFDLEHLEQRLTAIEEKMIAQLRASASEKRLILWNADRR